MVPDFLCSLVSLLPKSQLLSPAAWLHFPLLPPAAPPSFLPLFVLFFFKTQIQVSQIHPLCFSLVSPEIPFPSPFLIPSSAPERLGHSFHHHPLKFFFFWSWLEWFPPSPSIKFTTFNTERIRKLLLSGGWGRREQNRCFYPWHARTALQSFITWEHN